MRGIDRSLYTTGLSADRYYQSALSINAVLDGNIAQGIQGETHSSVWDRCDLSQ